MPAPDRGNTDHTAMRVYVPATVPMLRTLVTAREIFAVGGTAFALTPALREAYAVGNEEELAEVAMGEAARASLRLIAAELESTPNAPDDEPDHPDAQSPAPVYRRVVIAADAAQVRLRPDLDDAVVRLTEPISYDRIASVHVDLAEAEPAVAKAVTVVDAADLGDLDAEFVLGDAEDHPLAWYATQELPFLLDLL